MKKVILVSLFAVALTFSGVVTAQNAVVNNQQKKEVPAKKAMKVIYTCTMHPEVVSDKPGKCPKCNMDLVKKEVPVKAVPAKVVTKKMVGM